MLFLLTISHSKIFKYLANIERVVKDDDDRIPQVLFFTLTLSIVSKKVIDRLTELDLY